MVSGQQICRIPLRQLLMKACSFLMVMLVALHVSAPCSSTDFALELNRRIFVCNDNTLKLQMFLSCMNAPLALPILAITFASVPPCVLIIVYMVFHYNTSKGSTSLFTSLHCHPCLPLSSDGLEDPKQVGHLSVVYLDSDH